MKKTLHDDINIDFNNLSLNHSIIKEINDSENEIQDSVLSTFKPLLLSPINNLRDKKKLLELYPCLKFAFLLCYWTPYTIFQTWIEF